MKSKLSIGAKKIALIAVMTATVEAGKLALAWIPNVEVVTLLCALYGYVFGGMGIFAISIFVVIESFIWGFNTWVLSYIIHWNSVCLIFWLLGRFKVKRVVWLTATAVLLTIWFGVLTSLVDVGLFGGIKNNFFKRFSIYYMRGIVFYVIQTVCNLVVFLLAFKPLAKVMFKAKKKFFPNENCDNPFLMENE